MNAPREQFLAERQKGLGGSDIGVILGVNKWKSPVELWMEKTGRATNDVDNLPVRFGTYAEDFVAQEYTRETGRRVQRYNQMLRHPEFQMVIGHLDRLVVPDAQARASHRSEIRTDRLLEAKTASAYALGSAEWGPSGSDEIPMRYLAQCATYMALSGCQYADLAALFGNQELRIYHLTRDMDLERELLARAAEWWEAHVVADVAPEPQTESDVRALYPRDEVEAVEADEAAAEACRRILIVRGQIKELEAQEQAAKDIVTAYVGNAGALTGPTGTLATFKAARPSRCTDWKAACTAARIADDIIAAHTTETAGSRRLIIKEIEQ